MTIEKCPFSEHVGCQMYVDRKKKAGGFIKEVFTKIDEDVSPARESVIFLVKPLRKSPRKKDDRAEEVFVVEIDFGESIEDSVPHVGMVKNAKFTRYFFKNRTITVLSRPEPEMVSFAA